MSVLLDVRDLRVNFMTEQGIARAVDGVSFQIVQGRTLGVVGESGCGKSVTSRAIMGLVNAPGWVAGGEIEFASRDGVVDLAALPQNGDRMRHIRGSEIAMIFQEPMTALNPVFTIGDQIVEGLRLHEDVSETEAQRRAIAALAAVGIPAPEQRFREYPHQLSGGMRQRAMIAMAMICNPTLLIADEPTTALDVTIQAQVLDLMNDMRREFAGAIMFITHDLGVIASMADDVIVMYRGKVVESAAVRDLFKTPKHPYTRGLLRSVPSLTGDTTRLETIDGTVPSPSEVILGCAFASRCPNVMDKCREVVPALAGPDGHTVACFLHHDKIEEPHDD
ncbi:ABC transporter ATP-binding protein [Oceaniovalibus sp. ACAM 378]|uniref:ABC transporter ATP-binding protein n=1 Tax=Oceaniovalibus sp. ACAM 378 TaxID=2599923 RepID=UPI0011D6BF68|nr:ABC transporter ATP-binding protein [Oceaniovalibus sp. ACAM 378]TYB83903.1 ABC transporter ATP-binding protein [Oceaniovalibus sp. ACAM 378]